MLKGKAEGGHLGYNQYPACIVLGHLKQPGYCFSCPDIIGLLPGLQDGVRSAPHRTLVWSDKLQVWCPCESRLPIIV